MNTNINGKKFNIIKPPKKCICGGRYDINFNHPYFAEQICSKCGNRNMLGEEVTIYLKNLKEKRIKKAQLKLQRMFK